MLPPSDSHSTETTITLTYSVQVLGEDASYWSPDKIPRRNQADDFADIIRVKLTAHAVHMSREIHKFPILKASLTQYNIQLLIVQIIHALSAAHHSIHVPALLVRSHPGERIVLRAAL